MSDLAGGETVAITSGRRRVHVFERTMSTQRQRLLDATGEDFIDVWRLVTPMSAKQRARIDASAPVPTVDSAAPLAEQIEAITAAVTSHKWREEANSRARTAKKSRTVGDTIYDYYELGYGIPVVGAGVLWDRLDTLAADGVREIDAARLATLVTRPKN